MNLFFHLVNYGYDCDDVEQMVNAYIKGGREAAVDTFKWADGHEDDEEYDTGYTDELRTVIKEWENEYLYIPPTPIYSVSPPVRFDIKIVN